MCQFPIHYKSIMFCIVCRMNGLSGKIVLLSKQVKVINRNESFDTCYPMLKITSLMSYGEIRHVSRYFSSQNFILVLFNPNA